MEQDKLQLTDKMTSMSFVMQNGFYIGYRQDSENHCAIAADTNSFLLTVAGIHKKSNTKNSSGYLAKLLYDEMFEKYDAVSIENLFFVNQEQIAALNIRTLGDITEICEAAVNIYINVPQKIEEFRKGNFRMLGPKIESDEIPEFMQPPTIDYRL